MTQAQMILYMIKLLFGGLAAFFAIMLWSKTKDSAWMCMVAAIVVRYAGFIYDMMCDLAIVIPMGMKIYGISITSIIFAVLPDIFFIIAFILMLCRSNKF